MRSMIAGMGERVLYDHAFQKQPTKGNQMKLITSFFALAALTLLGSAFAQEESSSPSTSTEEKASATVETTPGSTQAEKASPTPAAEKSASPGAKNAASPATEKAASPAKKMSVEATLKDMENKWEASFASHDPSVAQSYLAADFIGVHPKGKILGKSGLIAEFKKDKDTYSSTKNEKLDVHMYGSNVAVVVGRAREKGTGKDGKFDRAYLFTDTWMERNGQWQCIASQAMELPRR
jgi:ketosteroid isomerase-like protein